MPPDENSSLQTSKYIYFEIYYWSTVGEAIIRGILLQGNVWIVNNENEEVHPL